MNINSNFEKSDTFEVIRGNRMEEVTAVARWWTLLHKEKTDKNEKDLATLTQKIKEMKENYGGIYFSNHFKVDQDVYLMDFGFLGPFKDEKASYVVQLELFEQKKSKGTLPVPSSKTRIAKHSQTVVATSGMDFYVGFQNPIPIQAHKWYLLQFVLNGPDTWRCEKTSHSVNVQAGTSSVKFDFTDGSKQMRSIRFKLP